MYTADVLFPLYITQEILPELVSEKVSIVVLSVLNNDGCYAGSDLRGELFHAVQTGEHTRIVEHRWQVNQGGRVRQI